MAKITVLEACDNSPKQQFIKEFNLNIIEGNIGAVLECLADGIRWEVAGLKVMNDKAEIEKSLRAMARDDIEAYTLAHIIAHGSKAASSGTMRMKNGETVSFCDIYVFDGPEENPHIKEITTFGGEVMGER